VGLIFEKVPRQRTAGFELLKKQQPDADRHPGGYRQLELEVRHGIREVEDTLFACRKRCALPGILRKDLIDMDDA